MSVCRELWVLVSFNFMATWLYFCINEVCRELEDPFNYEPNDLPLTQLCYEFNERQLSFMHGLRVNLHFVNENLESKTVLCAARDRDDGIQEG